MILIISPYVYPIMVKKIRQVFHPVRLMMDQTEIKLIALISVEVLFDATSGQIMPLSSGIHVSDSSNDFAGS